MYYVIKPSGVVEAPSLAALRRKTGYTMSDDEFTVVGKDFVAQLTDLDITFVRDKTKMESLLFGSFFRKDNSVKFITLFIFIFQFLFFFILNSKIGG